jgi:hypothetical protein
VAVEGHIGDDVYIHELSWDSNWQPVDTDLTVLANATKTPPPSSLSALVGYEFNAGFACAAL